MDQTHYFLCCLVRFIYHEAYGEEKLQFVKSDGPRLAGLRGPDGASSGGALVSYATRLLLARWSIK